MTVNFNDPATALGRIEPVDAIFYVLAQFAGGIVGVFIAGALLISQNRQNARADKRAELDYEVNVRTYREIKEMHAALRSLSERLTEIERRG